MPDDEDPRGIEILPDYVSPYPNILYPTTRWLFLPTTLETNGII